MLPMTLKRSASALAFVGVLALGACETTGGGVVGTQSAGALPPAPLAEDALSHATYWGARYEEDPTDGAMAVRFSSALRDLGSYDQATVLITRTVGEHPNNPDVLTEYARVLVATLRGEQALQPLALALAQRPNDWQLYSLQGVAYDHMADYDNATQSYERALSASPRNPGVMNNYALSRALAGDLDGAEALLRAAVAEPGATPQMRQNLALVLGLQGDFSEAEQFSRADLPPELVANNLAYYRAVLTQPAIWNELTQESVFE